MNIANLRGQGLCKITTGNSYDSAWKNLTDPERVKRRAEMAERAEETVIPKAPERLNKDKFVLNLPAVETIYKRQEFSTDERMAEGCAYCCTYMERVLNFGSGAKIISSSYDGYFVINTDRDQRTFGKSGADMDDISHAVEETWELRTRSLEQTTLSGSLSGSVTKNGRTFGGSLGFEMQSTVYRYLSVSETKGMVSYKDGSIGAYREKEISYQEIYDMCAKFLAEAFGEKSADMLPDGDEKNSPKNPEQKRGVPESQLGKLREFIEKNLSAVRKKDPDCKSLKIFEDTYSKLKAYDFTDIASLVEKMFAEGMLLK